MFEELRFTPIMGFDPLSKLNLRVSRAYKQAIQYKYSIYFVCVLGLLSLRHSSSTLHRQHPSLFRFGRATVCILLLCSFRPEQFVRIGFTPAKFALVSGQSFSSMFFVKGARYHVLVPFLRFVVFCYIDAIVIAIATTITVLAPNNVLYQWHIPALARRIGKRPPIAEIDRSLLDRPALQRHSRGGRIHIETSSVQIPTPALDGIPADKSPRKFMGEDARGDSVSLAGQNSTILLQCRSGGFGLVTGH